MVQLIVKNHTQLRDFQASIEAIGCQENYRWNKPPTSTQQEPDYFMTTIYHNPRCSKSRQTLQLLQQHSDDIEIIEYLKAPPSKEQLQETLDLLGLKPRELMRTGESIYQKLNLDNQSLDDAALIQAMLEHPILIERPIVINNGKAVIGRPPENVLDII